MKTLCLSLLVSAVAPGLQAQAPAAPAPAVAPTLAQSLDRSLKGMEGEVVPAAEAMPEEKFAFAPTQGEFKGVKTFAEQIKHIASVNVALAAALLEEKPAMEIGGDNGPEALKTKAEIVKYLKDSFAYLHKAFGTLTEANVMGLVKSPWGQGKGSRLGFATIAQGHGFNHYGQMVVYLRMNGIIPPASRR